MLLLFCRLLVPLCHLGSALTARRWTRCEPSSARPASDRDSLRLRPLYKKARRQCRRHPTQTGSVRAVRLWIKAAASSARCVSALVWPLALQSHRCCPAQDLCLTVEQRLVFIKPKTTVALKCKTQRQIRNHERKSGTTNANRETRTQIRKHERKSGNTNANQKRKC